MVKYSMKKKYDIGLLVGRFQPFHKGHLWLLKHALRSVSSLVIGIGSTNVEDQDNPFSYEERKTMIEMVIQNEGLGDRVIKIISLIDFHDDEKWFQNTIKLAGKFNVVIGNNEWVNGIFEKRGYPIVRVGFYKRYLMEGEKIRKLMKEKKPWENRVPDYLVKDFKTH